MLSLAALNQQQATMHVTTCYPFNYSNSHTREASDITYASPQVHFKGSNSRRTEIIKRAAVCDSKKLSLQ